MLSERWPVIALSGNGSLAFRSPDDEFEADESTDLKVLWLERVQASEQRPRRRPWIAPRLRPAA